MTESEEDFGALRRKDSCGVFVQRQELRIFKNIFGDLAQGTCHVPPHSQRDDLST